MRFTSARAALVNQLRSVDPPLNESDITRERLTLEEAILKVEAEAAKRSRPNTADGAEDRPPPRDDFSAPQRGLLPREERRPSLSDEGLRGFREAVAEAERLGGAAAEANRSARDVYDAATDRPPHDEPPVPGAGNPAFEPSAPSYDDEDHAYAPPARSYGRLIKIVLLLLIVAGVAGAAYWQRNTLASLVASFRTYFEMDMWDLAIPIFGFGVIAFIFAYLFLRRWSGIRS